jgi:hypothetical protein
MKRVSVIAALFMCVGLYASPKKETPADMTTAKNIFVGWVDINLDDWKALGYDTKQSWSAVIDRNNEAFQKVCQTELANRQITGAKDRSDENASGQDLHVKFSDVRFDVDSYRLDVSIHFIDPKSGSELASLPLRAYRSGHFSVDSCLHGALEKLAEKLQEEVARPPKK